MEIIVTALLVPALVGASRVVDRYPKAYPKLYSILLGMILLAVLTVSGRDVAQSLGLSQTSSVVVLLGMGYLTALLLWPWVKGDQNSNS